MSMGPDFFSVFNHQTLKIIMSCMIVFPSSLYMSPPWNKVYQHRESGGNFTHRRFFVEKAHKILSFFCIWVCTIHYYQQPQVMCAVALFQRMKWIKGGWIGRDLLIFLFTLSSTSCCIYVWFSRNDDISTKLFLFKFSIETRGEVS